MEFNFETGSLLLLIAAVVAMLTRRLRLPYSVGLVVAGIALAILPFAPRPAEEGLEGQEPRGTRRVEDLNGRCRASLQDAEGSGLRCAKRSLGVLAE
jgi:hypothetical protein